MRFVTGLLAFLAFSLPIGADAVAAPDGKRVLVLATSNTNPYIGALDIDIHQVRHAGRDEGDQRECQLRRPAVQSQQIDDAIAQKYDMIVLGATSMTKPLYPR